MPVEPSMDPRIPPRHECVLPAMLDHQAERIPDRVLAVFEDGSRWTYAEARRLARGTAAAFEKLGVRRGDRVLVWLTNGPDVVRLWMALGYLGAIFTPINTAFKGRMLEHVIENSGARIIVLHASLAERLDAIGHGELETVVILGGQAEVPSGLGRMDAAAVMPIDAEPAAPDPALEPWDIHGIFYTSGTTGVSKGVMCTHLHTYTMSIVCMAYLTADDRFMVTSPYFHIAAPFVAYQVIAKGASMAVITKFSTQDFWDRVRELGTTCGLVMGAMANFLLKAPPRPGDRDNPLRAILQVPLAHDAAAFSQRFDVDIYTEIDMTEMGPAIVSDVIPRDRPPPQGYCGRVRPGMEVRLVDEFDREVPVGETGEMIARCEVPWVITPGYWRMPEATARAWRNGWFHTGDGMRRDEEGNYYFVDRVKDAIRRRGENISSFEVEVEVMSHEAVQAAAAIPVPSEHGEDEVMVVIEPKPDHGIEPEALVQYLVARMPHYMVPRFVRIMAELPRTESDKIQKHALRGEGVTPDTWDREAAGIVIKREKVG